VDVSIDLLIALSCRTTATISYNKTKLLLFLLPSVALFASVVVVLFDNNAEPLPACLLVLLLLLLFFFICQVALSRDRFSA